MKDGHDALTELKQQLWTLFRSMDVVADLNVSVETVSDQPEVVVRGSTDALVYLAYQCLEVAAATAPGHHSHVDSANYANEASVPLVIAKNTY